LSVQPPSSGCAGMNLSYKNMWFQGTFNFNSSFFSLNRRSPSNAESLGRP
jgi:hypothetical protein